MFNRTYQQRAARQGSGRAAAEAILRPQSFYRPARRVSPCARPAGPVSLRKRQEDPRQMTLPFALTEQQLADEFDRLFPK
jgi:hypothetical protein